MSKSVGGVELGAGFIDAIDYNLGTQHDQACEFTPASSGMRVDYSYVLCLFMHMHMQSCEWHHISTP